MFRLWRSNDEQRRVVSTSGLEDDGELLGDSLLHAEVAILGDHPQDAENLVQLGALTVKNRPFRAEEIFDSLPLRKGFGLGSCADQVPLPPVGIRGIAIAVGGPGGYMRENVNGEGYYEIFGA